MIFQIKLVKNMSLQVNKMNLQVKKMIIDLKIIEFNNKKIFILL
jgi:hypothetical protein